MTRGIDKAGRHAWPAAVLLGVLWLVVAGSAAARMTSRADPPYAWWEAADLALARGDCATAVALLEEHLNEGEDIAIARLGDIHESGRCAGLGLPPAPQFYERMIERGFDIAKTRLGYLYLKGLGVPRDAARAKQLFEEAVLELLARVSPEVRRRVMLDVMGRHGMPEKLEAVLDWADVIEAGPPQVQYETAVRLRTGNGLPRDEKAARHLLHLAMRRGSAAARFELGMWELAQASNEEDRRWALGMIARAAKAGHVPAIKEIGLRLAEGNGVVRDDFAAYVLLLKAKAAGEQVDEALASAGSRLSDVVRRVASEEARNPRFLFALGFPDD